MEVVSLSSGIPGGKCLQIFVDMADTALHVPAEARHAFLHCVTIWERLLLCVIFWEGFCTVWHSLGGFYILLFHLWPASELYPQQQEASAAFSGVVTMSRMWRINVRAHVALSLSLASQHCNWVEWEFKAVRQWGDKVEQACQLIWNYDKSSWTDMTLRWPLVIVCVSILTGPIMKMLSHLNYNWRQVAFVSTAHRLIGRQRTIGKKVCSSSSVWIQEML